MRTIYLAGGCFRGLQKFIDQFEGVLSTEVGYANGPDAGSSQAQGCGKYLGLFEKENDND